MLGLGLCPPQSAVVGQYRQCFESKLKSAEEQMDLVRTELLDTIYKVRWRPGLRCISPYGGYSIALARNYGHCSTKVAVKMMASTATQLLSRELIKVY